METQKQTFPVAFAFHSFVTCQSPLLLSRIREQNESHFTLLANEVIIESTPQKGPLFNFCAYVVESKLHLSGIVVMSICLSVCFAVNLGQVLTYIYIFIYIYLYL